MSATNIIQEKKNATSVKLATPVLNKKRNIFDPESMDKYPKEAPAIMTLANLKNPNLHIFAEDINDTAGPKRFYIANYTDIYKYSINNDASLYEFRSVDTNKLFFDIDIGKDLLNQYKININNCDTFFNDVVTLFIDLVKKQLRKEKIPDNTPIIVLKSDNKIVDNILVKVSAHIIYPKIVVSKMIILKNFVKDNLIKSINNNTDVTLKYLKLLQDPKVIDTCIYSKGYFRMMYSTKRKVNCKLCFYEGLPNLNYTLTDEYIRFLDSLISNVKDIEHIHKIREELYLNGDIIKNKENNKAIKLNIIFDKYDSEDEPDEDVVVENIGEEVVIEVKQKDKPINKAKVNKIKDLIEEVVDDDEKVVVVVKEEKNKEKPKKVPIVKQNNDDIFKELLNKVETNTHKEFYELAYNLSITRISNYDSWVDFIFFCIKFNFYDLCLFISKIKYTKYDASCKDTIKVIFQKNLPHRINEASLFMWSKEDNPENHNKIILKYLELKRLTFNHSDEILLQHLVTYMINIINVTEERISTDSINKLLKYPLVILHAPTCVGKTFTTQEMALEFLKTHPNAKILSIVSRQSMAATHITGFSKLNMNSYLDLDKEKNRENKQFKDRYIISFEQLGDLEHREYDIIILDEATSLLGHLYSPTMTRTIIKSFTRLSKLIVNGKLVIAADAIVTDALLVYLSKLRSTDQMIYYRNRFQNKKINNVSIPLIIYHRKNNSVLQEIILFCNKFETALKNKESIMIMTDSLSIANLVYEYLFSILKDKDYFKIYTGDVGNKDDFLNIFKLWIGKCVIFSPRILYGLDVTIVYKNIWAIYKEHTIDSFSMLQQISRARNTAQVNILFLDEKNSFNFNLKLSFEDNAILEKNLIMNYLEFFDNKFTKEELRIERTKVEVYKHLMIIPVTQPIKKNNIQIDNNEIDKNVNEFKQLLLLKQSKHKYAPEEDGEKKENVETKIKDIKEENKTKEDPDLEVKDFVDFRSIHNYYSWYQRLFSKDKSQLLISLCKEQGYNVQLKTILKGYENGDTEFKLKGTMFVNLKDQLINVLTGVNKDTELLKTKDVYNIFTTKIDSLCKLFGILKEDIIKNDNLMNYILHKDLLETKMASLMLYKKKELLDRTLLYKHCRNFPEIAKNTEINLKMDLIEWVEKVLKIDRFCIENITTEKQLTDFQKEVLANIKLFECFKMPTSKNTRNKRIQIKIKAIKNIPSLVRFVADCYNNVDEVYIFKVITQGKANKTHREYTLNFTLINSHYELINLLNFDSQFIIDIKKLLK